MLREEVKALGQEYCKSADKSIRDQVVSMPEYQRAGTIFCFVGRQDEINTMPLILDALFQGKRVGVPKCVAEGIMEVRRITGKEDLEPGSYGILEPKKGTGLIGPEEIDLSLSHAFPAAQTEDVWAMEEAIMTGICGRQQGQRQCCAENGSCGRIFRWKSMICG